MPRHGSKKSHNGCAKCKARKVKCDEMIPCRNCVRRGDTCVINTGFLQPTQSTAAIPWKTDASKEWRQDLELMHHYARHVCEQAMGARGDIQDLFREAIPAEAMKHDFLMHSLLAMSALSLASLQSSNAQHYLSVCDQHQHAAVMGFRGVLAGEITPDLGNALFACAAVISMSAMARSCATVASTPYHKYIDMDNIAQVFLLTRGVRDVLDVARDDVLRGPFSGIVKGHHIPDDVEVLLPGPVEDRFDELWVFLGRECEPGSSEFTDLSEGLRGLKEVYRTMRYFGNKKYFETGRIWSWSVRIPAGFIDLVKAENQPALIVLAHFIAAASLDGGAWYTQGWCHYCMEGIRIALEPKMLPLLSWPCEQVENGFVLLFE